MRDAKKPRGPAFISSFTWTSIAGGGAVVLARDCSLAMFACISGRVREFAREGASA